MRRRLRSLLGGSPLERASWLRHLSIAVAVGAAWAMRHELSLTNQVLWILGLAAALNFVTTFLSDLPGWAHWARGLSFLFGISGWAALGFVSGGASSPFVAGLWLEIVFSAFVLSPPGTLYVAAAALAAIWLQETLAVGAHGPFGRVWVQSGFVAVIGCLTFLASKRWAQTERSLSRRAVELGQRLRDLETELNDARRLEKAGEGVARFAHGMKNVVHSLRGFTKLIEGPRLTPESRSQAIDGLRLAIDRIEEIALTTLDASAAGSREQHQASTTAAEIDHIVDDVLGEVGARHQGMNWVKVRSDGVSGVSLSRAMLREVLLVLVENAAEASGCSGEVKVQVNANQGAVNLVVQDRGPGLAPGFDDRIFRLGATTKESGHGLGLFLARRLVESRGGRLTAAPGADGGALFSVTLPAQEI